MTLRELVWMVDARRRDEWQSLTTVGRYAAPGEIAPDFQGAIGVNQDQIEGTDITVPIYNFTETHQIDDALVTGAYKAALFFLTGKVNDAPFKGFARGEVLFLGASGAKRGFEDWEITFRFAASPNVTDLHLGNIVVASKEGWHYLWIRSHSQPNAGHSSAANCGAWNLARLAPCRSAAIRPAGAAATARCNCSRCSASPKTN